MQLFKKRAEQIPDLVQAAWVFQGTDLGGKPASILFMRDRREQVILDITDGLDGAPPMTARMQSYLTGLADVGAMLKQRKSVDEDGVTTDDLEKAAILMAFPKVAQNADAMRILKSHLDALQKHKIIDEVVVKVNEAQGAREGDNEEAAAPAPKPAERPAAAKPAKAAEAAKPAEPAKAAAEAKPEAKPEPKKADAAKDIPPEVKVEKEEPKDDLAEVAAAAAASANKEEGTKRRSRFFGS